MNAVAYLEALRERWLSGTARSSEDPPYFSAEGKRLRRSTARRKPTRRGTPIAGTGVRRFKYRFDDEDLDSNSRSRRERNALRFEDKAN